MIKVRVPATTANLGPGFDTLGLALKLYNYFDFQEIDRGLEIIGVEEKYNNEDNLIYLSMLKTFEKIGYRKKGIRIRVESEIPVSRGLGSSASCIVGGIVGANEISNGKLTDHDILNLATEIEGHPDNISPAIFGGLAVSIIDGGQVLYNRLDIEEKFKLLALVPDFTLSTEKSRSVLPKVIDYRDAVDNVGRVSILLSALANGRLDLLKYGFKDNLHQPYRGGLIENYLDIVSECERLGSIGSYISGAGPTIMCLIEKEDLSFEEYIRKYLKTLNKSWKVKELGIDFNGFKVLKSKAR